MDNLKRNLFYFLLVLAGLGAAYGYWAWQLDPYLLGTVESRVRPVSAWEGGRIQEILVTVGSRVRTGQTLARLDMSDTVRVFGTGLPDWTDGLEQTVRQLVTEQA